MRPLKRDLACAPTTSHPPDNSADKLTMPDLAPVSIVMTYRDRMTQLRNTLRSFVLHGYTNVSVVIVDDGSEREPVDPAIATAFDFPISIISTSGNRTYSNPCVPFNRGFARATGEIILIQNAECLHVSDLVSHTRANITPSRYLTYACFGLSEKESERLNGHGGWTLDDVDAIVSRNRRQAGGSDGSWYNHSEYRPKALHFASAIARDNLLRLGGFDERYATGTAYDDEELVVRVRRMGLAVEIIDDHAVIHQWHGRERLRSKWDQHARQGRNELLFRLVTLHEKTPLPSARSVRYRLFTALSGILVPAYVIARVVGRMASISFQAVRQMTLAHRS